MHAPVEPEIGVVLSRQAAIQSELRRRRYLLDPVLWARHVLGDTLWSQQQRIMESVRDNRRTAVRSCHEIGKSFIAAEVIGWFLATRKVGEAFVVTSAPTAKQVAAILWREIGRVHARGNLPGRVTATEWKATPVMPDGRPGKEELVAFGRKPDDYDMTAFQGIHALEVLVVFDEADGMPGELWEAADSLMANDDSKMLVIGNPDNPQSQFREVCKPGSGWNTIGVSAFDSPNFTGEPMPEKVRKQLIGPTYVEEKRKKWAPRWQWNPEGTEVICPEGVDPLDTHPYWQSKILGRFPERADANGLIPEVWIQAAKARSLAPIGPNELGVDVGGGGDSSTIGQRRGPRFRILHEDKNPDTMQTTGKVVELLGRTNADCAKVDVIGIGRGVVDRGLEQDLPFIGINVGEKATDPKAHSNQRAEFYWGLRELFETGQVDIDEDDEDLAGELVELKYKRTSQGRIEIESKDSMKKRGVPSPNRAEAMMLAFAKPKVKKGGVMAGSCTW